MKKELCTIILLVALAFTANAQVVYTCDFENTTQNQQWVLNSARNAATQQSLLNKWFIGGPGQEGTGGQNGLYISSDNGQTNMYSSSSKGQTVAYLPLSSLTPGQYRLNFDWLAMGADSTDGLYVTWIPATTATNSAYGLTSFSAWATSGAHFKGNSYWSPASWQFQVTNANQNGKLVFVWCNTTKTAANPGACVDNIEITRLPVTCSEPTNLRYDKLTSVLSWSGSASAYDIRVVNSFTNNVISINNYQGNSCTIPLTDEGYCYFYVRSLCDATHKSSWIHCGELVYIPGMRCLEYMDIDGTGRATGTCYNATYATYTSGGQGSRGIVGNGSPLSVSTTHAIHYDPKEIDPNTTAHGGLRTVAPGEIASVRVGAYDGSGQSASVEYKYKVKAGMSDLLVLKYAVVLYSGGHSAVENPRFKLDILDGQGHQFPSSCSHLEFMCSEQLLSQNSGWTQEGDYFWKDWDTVTVSLREYIGQTITIRLTSIRCTYDTHFAKAYYAINCQSGDLQGISCGDYSTDHFDGPDGFNYRWYKESNRSVTCGTDQTLGIQTNDTSIYILRCMNKRDPNCYFELVANPNPRYPRTEVTWNRRSGKCENKVDFTNTSYVAFINRVTGEPMATTDSTGLDYVYIDFGDGSDTATLDRNIPHLYPDTGGTFTIRMRSSMSGGICEDEMSYDITLPNILEDRWLDSIHLCEADVYTTFKKRRITKDDAKMQILGIGDTVYNYLDTLGGEYNEYGCEIDRFQPVRFHKEFHSYKVDTLCLGKAYQWGDTSYTVAGKDIQYKLKSVYGCDSIAHLDLYVRPRLKTNAWPLYACSGDEVMLISTDLKDQIYDDIRLFEGGKYEGKPGVMAYTQGTSDPSTWYKQYTGLHVYTDSLAQADGFAAEYFFKPGEDWVIEMPHEKMRPATYHFKFETETNCNCADSAYEKVVEIRYGYEAVDANYAYITTTGPRYNGGYDLETNKIFQWYRDSEPIIPGGDEYYLKTKWESDINHVYYCVITDTITGEITTTCPIEYGSVEDVSHDDPRVGLEYVQAEHTYRVYNILGHLIGIYSGEEIQRMATTQRETAELRGLYILVSEDTKTIEDANATIKILIP